MIGSSILAEGPPRPVDEDQVTRRTARMSPSAVQDAGLAGGQSEQAPIVPGTAWTSSASTARSKRALHASVSPHAHDCDTVTVAPPGEAAMHTRVGRHATFWSVGNPRGCARSRGIEASGPWTCESLSRVTSALVSASTATVDLDRRRRMRSTLPCARRWSRCPEVPPPRPVSGRWTSLPQDQRPRSCGYCSIRVPAV